MKWYWLLLAALCLPQSAWAYIDPGTGSMLVQLVAAALLGSIFAIKIGWRRLIGFFSFRSGRRPSAARDDRDDQVKVDVDKQ